MHRRPEKNKKPQKKLHKSIVFYNENRFRSATDKITETPKYRILRYVGRFSGQLVFHVLLIARILRCFSTKIARGGRVPRLVLHAFLRLF